DPLTEHLGQHGEEILRQSLRDLSHPDELLELGLALFLDRPLGAGKGPGEADQTTLLSHLVFSRSIALHRLKFLGETAAADFSTEGVPLSAVGGRARPGTVSAVDARQVAADFVFLRTTASSARDFFQQYDFGPLFARFQLDDI